MESINDSHREYIKIIRRLTPEERLKKCFELNELAKQLFLTGLKNRFPNLSKEEIIKKGKVILNAQ